MPTPRVLTERELNRAVLARQLLLERATVPVPRALERMCGLQDQYAPNGYIGLWTRLDGFRRGDLTRALERKTVIQATLMRATIHLVSRRDYWPMAMAIDEPLREWWFRATKRRSDERRLRTIDARGRELLEHGPKRRKEILTDLGLSPTDFAGVGLWTQLVRVPPSGTWEQRRADLFGTAERWIGPPAVTADEGRDLLVRRYLGAFGPATRADISSFTGLSLKMLDAVLERLQLRTFESEQRRHVARRARRTDPTCRRAGAGARSSPPGTRRFWFTLAGPRSCPRRTGRTSSTRSCRSPSARSWWTDRSRERGASTAPR